MLLVVILGEGGEMEIAGRSRFSVSYPDREGNGTAYKWHRVINGVPHWFTFVLMPSGQRRYFVSRYNGYGDDGTEWGRTVGMKFGCAWTQVHALTVKVANGS